METTRKVAVLVYLADDGVDELLLLRHLQDGADLGHVGGDLLVELSTFLCQSTLVVMHSPQRVEQLFKLGTKLLQSMFTGQLCKRLRLQHAYSVDKMKANTHDSRQVCHVVTGDPNVVGQTSRLPTRHRISGSAELFAAAKNPPEKLRPP